MAASSVTAKNLKAQTIPGIAAMTPSMESLIIVCAAITGVAVLYNTRYTTQTVFIVPRNRPERCPI